MAFYAEKAFFLSVFLFAFACFATVEGTAEQEDALLMWSSSWGFPTNNSITGWGLNNSDRSDVCTWNGVLCCNRGFIRGLDLNGVGITGSLKGCGNYLASVQRHKRHALSFLKVIDLGRNMLEGSIPEGFDKFGDLHTLILSSNYLSGAVPATLLDILTPTLKTIDVSNNALGGYCLPQNLIKPFFGPVIHNQTVGQFPEDIFQRAHLRFSGNNLKWKISNYQCRFLHSNWHGCDLSNMTQVCGCRQCGAGDCEGPQPTTSTSPTSTSSSTSTSTPTSSSSPSSSGSSGSSGSSSSSSSSSSTGQPSPTNEPDTSGGGTNVGAIVGATVGAAAAVGAAGAGFALWRKNRAASTESGPETSDQGPNTNPLYEQTPDQANPLFQEPEAGID